MLFLHIKTILFTITSVKTHKTYSFNRQSRLYTHGIKFIHKQKKAEQQINVIQLLLFNISYYFTTIFLVLVTFSFPILTKYTPEAWFDKLKR